MVQQRSQKYNRFLFEEKTNQKKLKSYDQEGKLFRHILAYGDLYIVDDLMILSSLTISEIYLL